MEELHFFQICVPAAHNNAQAHVAYSLWEKISSEIENSSPILKYSRDLTYPIQFHFTCRLYGYIKSPQILYFYFNSASGQFLQT